MKKSLLVVLVGFLAGLAVCSCISAPAFNSASVPLPQQIQIIPPNPNLPLEIKALSGKWGGIWWDPSSRWQDLEGLNAILIVEEIFNEHQANVVYCWGDDSEWNITKGCKRVKANISRNEKEKLILSLLISLPGKYEFRVEVEKNKLEGVRRGYYTNYITMKRIQ